MNIIANNNIANELVLAGIILIALFCLIVFLSRLYRRSSKERAFVRTGLGGQKVVMDGGALVLPMLQETIVVNMNTLKLEGAKNNIHCNAISPVAATRMTEGLMPPDVLAKLNPKYVTPAVVYLVSEEAPNGVIVTAGGGAFAVARIHETEGAYLGGEATAETVRDHFAQIADEAGQKAYFAGGEQGGKFFRKMAGG